VPLQLYAHLWRHKLLCHAHRFDGPLLSDDGMLTMSTATVESERGRLITRYSLTVSPLFMPVHAYLAPLSLPQSSRRTDDDAHETFTRLLALAKTTIERDAELSDGLTRVALLVQRPISEAYLGAFDSLRWSPEDDMARTYVSVVYARALHHLQHTERDPGEFVANVRRLLVESRPALAQRLTAMEGLPPDFVGHLIVEAEARRGENPFFRERLQRAGELFNQHLDSESPWPSRQAHPLSAIGVDNLGSRTALPAHMALAMTVHD